MSVVCFILSIVFNDQRLKQGNWLTIEGKRRKSVNGNGNKVSFSLSRSNVVYLRLGRLLER